jgi:hypothetical protein
MEQRKFRLTDLLSITLSIVTLFTVVASGFFWFYKTDELPKKINEVQEKVAISETRIDKLEAQMIENKTKTELIYQGVLEIRSVLLKR